MPVADCGAQGVEVAIEGRWRPLAPPGGEPGGQPLGSGRLTQIGDRTAGAEFRAQRGEGAGVDTAGAGVLGMVEGGQVGGDRLGQGWLSLAGAEAVHGRHR